MNAISLRTRTFTAAFICLLLVAACAHAQRRRQPANTRPKTTPVKPPSKQPQPAQSPTPHTVASGKTVTVHWNGRAGVTRYRLQVARDRDFGDIVFDRAVMGLEAQVELPSGDTFFWRVAPAAQETGEFSAPEPVLSGAGVPTGASTTTVGANGVLRSPADVGWQSFTGDALRPLTAPLRGATTADVVVVNTEGNVFALDGTNGSALWTARFRPNARRGEVLAPPAAIFTPIIVRVVEGASASIVVAYDGGVRALEGETGRELWRAPLAGAAISGVVADLDNDKTVAELAVVTAEPALHFIDARSGKSLNTAKLDAALVGQPIPFITAAERGIAMALAGGMIDVRRMDGSRFHAVKFDVPFTTPPLIFIGPNGALIVIGTEHGLLFLSGDDMKPLGKVTTPDDHPRGRLGIADLDHDGVFEIVALLESGKLAVVSATGRVIWTAPGAGDAYTPTFVDLNGDGVLDVLVASGQTFAQGFSGRDGALLWQVDDVQSKPGESRGAAALRSLTLIGAGTARPLVVSGDQTRAAVRAVGLPGTTVKVAAQ
jgi:outer membrane protein assembly factor BamB